MSEMAFLFNQETVTHGKLHTGTTAFLCRDGSSIVIDLNEQPIRKRAVGRDDSQAAKFYKGITSVELSSAELKVSFSDGSSFKMDMSLFLRS